MPNDLQKFSNGLFTKGYRTYGPEIDAIIQLHKDSFNISTGINNGIGPRYGMAPIPGHFHTEASSTDASPIMQAEKDTGSLHVDREKIFGIIPFSVGEHSAPKSAKNHYVVLTASDLNVFNFNLLCTADSGEYTRSPKIESGLSPAFGIAALNYGYPAQPTIPNIRNPGFWRLHMTRQINFEVSDRAQRITDISTIESDVNHVRWASLSVSGKEESLKWWHGDSDPTSIAAPSSTSIGAVSPNLTRYSPYSGVPFYWHTRNVPVGDRAFTFYAIYSGTTSGDRLAYIYRKTYDIEEASFSGDYDSAILLTDTMGSMTRTNRIDGTTPSYTDILTVLVNDPNSKMVSQYDAFLVAAKKPVAMIMQRAAFNNDLTIHQPVDLTVEHLKPYTRNTVDYDEDGALKNTCWRAWPDFVDGTALAKSSATAFNGTDHVRLGEANTGVLRSNTVYEFAFSIYDKTTGTESNVSEDPAKVQTGSDDFVRISLYRDEKNGSSQFLQKIPYGVGKSPIGMGWLPELPYNFLEIRIYYRAIGSVEWLPALFIDAAKYFFYPDHKILWMCEGEIAALPGGQPGGFIDYSPLPKDEFIDVVSYNNRAFWIGKKQIVFSLQKNVFAYPTRNTIPAATGSFLGGIVHAYPGEAEQDERLIVFGSSTVYVGYFTGRKSQQPVRVSPDTVGYFDVDGSDFVLKVWTDSTAFSARSAVVADGVLYWWGPDGVFRDTGVDLPVSVSDDIEPDLFNLYDTQNTDEIHCTFNSATKEIIWFYPPRESDGYLTHGLVFNIRKGEFYPAKWKGKIDWSQQLEISKDDSNALLAGKRTIVGARKVETPVFSGDKVQRAYFFDQRNRSGDMFPKGELMVKSVSEPVSGQRRLNLASRSFDNPHPCAGMAVGDYIAINQGLKYATTMTDCDDMIAKITALNTTANAGYIDILLPTGASMDTSATLTSATYFPVWHRAASGAGLNGISYQVKTRYWEPSGPNFFYYWLYLFARFKVNLWKMPKDFFSLSFGYKTPITNPNDFIYDNIKLSDNTDGHFSLYHQFRPGNGNNSGQALKFDFSNHHIGNEWVLEYLEMHCREEDGNLLKMFEG